MNAQKTIWSFLIGLAFFVMAAPALAQTSATNVSAGEFGANTGGGTYTFPGSVGVGTTAPLAKLHVNGTFFGRATYATYASDGVWDTNAQPSKIFMPMGQELRLGYSDAASGQYYPSLGFAVKSNAVDDSLLILQARVALGAAPELFNRFQVSGGGTFGWGPGATAVDTTLYRSGAGSLRTNASLVVDGNLGVGTTAPLAKLHVNGTFFGRATYATYASDGVWDTNAQPSKIFMPMGQELRLGYSDAASGQYYPSLGFAVKSNAVNDSLLILQARVALGAAPESFNRFQVSGGGTFGWGPGATAVDTTLYRSGAGSLRTNASLVVDGNLGVGTMPAAGYKLHVVGNAHVQGTLTGNIIQAHYQDLAEWVPATVPMSPGTVVTLDPEVSNQVMPSSRAYDMSVAGVVSAQPGVILGVAGESKEQIATTGRVKVRVDARKAPIRIGDLLVSSDVPGTAMRSEPMDINGRVFHQPGTIIGKALEALDSGEGEILVLLSLQ